VNRLPVPAAAEPRRALPFMADLPSGHTLHLVANDWHAPHLRPGEWAVVDCTDRAIQWGELFMVRQSNGPALWAIYPESERDRIARAPGEECAWLRHLNGPRTPEEAFAWLRSGRAVTTADGPYLLSCLEPQIIGRVVGIYEEGRA
jgi:hypothetical protein